MAAGTMERGPATADPAAPAKADGAGDYNFAHFRPRHVWSDATGTLAARGIPPGETAPDFELPRTNGGSLRLSKLRDKPVLLHFGSPT